MVAFSVFSVVSVVSQAEQSRAKPNGERHMAHNLFKPIVDKPDVTYISQQQLLPLKSKRRRICGDSRAERQKGLLRASETR